MVDGERTLQRSLGVWERPRWLDVVTGLAFLGGLVTFITLVSMKIGFAVFGLQGAVIGGVFRFAQAWQNIGARRRTREVKVTPAGIEIEGRVVPRERIVNGFFQPRSRARGSGMPSTVRLLDRWKRVVFEAEMAEPEAREALAILGLDAASKRAEFRIASRVRSQMWRAVAFALAIFCVYPVAHLLLLVLGVHSLFPAFLLASIALLLAMLPGRMTVGIDGLHLRWLGKKQFLRMADITSVEQGSAGEVRIGLADGRTEVLHTTDQRRSDTDRLHRDALHARIVEAWEAHRRNDRPADAVALVGRGSRTNEEWQRALLGLEAEAGGYRQSAMRAEDLWRVVEDPRAPEDARAGAAVLLRRSFDDEGRRRVRVAAEATASPRLRVALDAASGASEDEALAALFALEPCEADVSAPSRLRHGA